MLMNHENGKKLLLELVSLLKGVDYGVNSLPYFLIQGTALGAYRDKGFVPTEKDIDIGVLQEEFTKPLPGEYGRNRAETLANLLILSGFDIEVFVQPFTEIKTIVAYKYGCKADIVGQTRWKDKRFTSTPVRHWVPKPYCIVHDAAMLENYETVEMFDIPFLVPSPIEQYLELEYGSEWRTPKDDHVSRTRIYDFINKEGIPSDYLESQPVTG